MPKDGLCLLVVVELEEFESLDGPHQGAGQIPQLRFQASRDGSIVAVFFLLLGTVVLQVQVVHRLFQRILGVHPVKGRVVIVGVFFVRDPCHGGGIRQSLTDGSGDVEGRGLVSEKGFSLPVLGKDGSVGHGDGDFHGGILRLGFFGTAFLDGFVECIPVGQPRRVGGAFREGIPPN